MKKIKLKSAVQLLGCVNKSEAIEMETKIFDENKIQVLNCFASIEKYMSMIIENEFLGDYKEGRKVEFEKFRSKILYTSWFNFNEKRKLVTEILIEESEVQLNKKEKEELKQFFIKIMNYRNMLTHGVFKTNGKISKIEYYQGIIMEKELDNKFWDEISNNLEKGFNMLKQNLIKKKILTWC